MSALTVLVVVGIVAYVISRQLIGESLGGRRVLLLPLVLTVIGIADLAGQGSHPDGTDIVLVAVSAAIAVAVGFGQGAIMRLKERDGHLWAKLPRAGLWLWVALVLSRGVTIAVAHATGAHVAASTSAILLTLGCNRLAQGAVVTLRAVAAGIPFAPEKDGRVFGEQLFAGSPARRP